MMIPDSAIVPSIATKPNGMRNASSAERRRRSGRAAPSARPSPCARSSCSWIISSVSTRQHEQRHAGGDRLLAARRILDGAAELDPVAERQRRAQRRRGSGRCRLRHVRPLRVAAHVGAHGDRRQPVAPPDDALLEPVVDVGDLRDRHGLAVARRDREIACRNDSCTRSAGAPRSTTSISSSRSRNCVTVMPDTALLRNCARSCELMPSTRALFWSTCEANHLRRLVPVELHVARHPDRARMTARDLARDRPHLRDVVAGHAELHREADRRTVLEPRHAPARSREVGLEQRDAAARAPARAPRCSS